MIAGVTWNIDPVKILTRVELALVLVDLARRALRSTSMRMNRVIFRLACCDLVAPMRTDFPRLVTMVTLQSPDPRRQPTAAQMNDFYLIFISFPPAYD